MIQSPARNEVMPGIGRQLVNRSGKGWAIHEFLLRFDALGIARRMHDVTPFTISEGLSETIDVWRQHIRWAERR